MYRFWFKILENTLKLYSVISAWIIIPISKNIFKELSRQNAQNPCELISFSRSNQSKPQIASRLNREQRQAAIETLLPGGLRVGRRHLLQLWQPAAARERISLGSSGTSGCAAIAHPRLADTHPPTHPPSRAQHINPSCEGEMSTLCTPNSCFCSMQMNRE